MPSIKIERSIDVPDREQFADDLLQYAEYRRQQVTEAAVGLVYQVLDAGGDGTVEEQDALLTAVLVRLAESMHHRANMALLMKEAKIRMGM